MFYGILAVLILICLGAYISTKVKVDIKYSWGFIIGSTVGFIIKSIT